MKTFVCVMRQEGVGCDYTIACGEKFLIFEAETIEAAQQAIIKTFGKEYFSGKADPSYYIGTLRTWKLFEVSSQVNMLAKLMLCAEEYKQAQRVEKKRKDEAAGRAKYEELKKRFG